jgi:hypothetical protein
MMGIFVEQDDLGIEVERPAIADIARYEGDRRAGVRHVEAGYAPFPRQPLDGLEGRNEENGHPVGRSQILVREQGEAAHALVETLEADGEVTHRFGAALGIDAEMGRARFLPLGARRRRHQRQRAKAQTRDRFAHAYLPPSVQNLDDAHRSRKLDAPRCDAKRVD